MKTMKIAGLALATTLIATSSSFAGILTTSTAAPEAAVFEQSSGASFTKTFGDDATQNGQSRGQTFVTGESSETGWAVSSLSIKTTGGSISYAAADTVTLTIFEWDGVDGNTDGTWTQGAGYIGVTDILAGTGMTDTFQETFSLETITTGGNTYLTFDVDCYLEELTTYAMFLQLDSNQYIQIGGGGTKAPDTYTGGMTLRTDGTPANTIYDQQDIQLYVDGIAAIPEPATLGLFAIFGGAMFMARRKRAL